MATVDGSEGSPSSPRAPRAVMLGRRQLHFPSVDLQPLVDSSHLVGDVAALRQQLHELGYLFIRGLHDREEVLAAREAVLHHVSQSGDTLDSKHPIREGVLRNGCGVGCVPFMEGNNSITHSEPVRRVLEGPRPFKFFKDLLGDEVTTFDYKWLRAMHHEGFTGCHVDSVYMSRGTPDLLTLWTPLGDVPVEMGVLAVCEGSHRLPGFKKFQDTYGKIDAEKLNLQGTGWFTEDPEEISSQFGGQWKTADFGAGDVLVFGMRTAHMSTTNTTRLARVSCDTRWQLASQPMDPRYTSSSVSGPRLLFGLLAKAEPTAVTDSGTRGQNSSLSTDAATSDGTKQPAAVTMEKLKVMWGL